jgi:cytochrome c oxidase assembly protein subunit 15
MVPPADEDARRRVALGPLLQRPADCGTRKAMQDATQTIARTTSADKDAMTPAIARDRRAVRFWLYGVLVVLFALVMVGGATRLTDSGLSITEWQPIHGVIPPLSEADWQEEFEKYRQIPEYEQINKGMSLAEFKVIFWWEWAHRLLARGVGLVFALPLAWFWVRGRLEQGVKPKLLGLLALGGLQGAVGWWMVKSGLADRVDVAHERLAVHLTLACLIFMAVTVVARGLAPHAAPPAGAETRRLALAMLALVLVQIFLGGLVAGLDAGLSYNTWPLMDGSLWPGGLLAIEPAWLNFLDNPKTVQFVHRLVAYALLAAAAWQAFRAVAGEGAASPHARRAVLFLTLVLIQAGVGIATLLGQVPLSLALVHQALALVVLGFAAAHWRGTKGAYPVRTNVRIMH